MLNYNHLYYFHVAAVEGSVAAAASRLGVTQPTVSEQLRALERSLRVELFERTQTGLKLTHPGRLAFEHTSQMFRLGERLVEALGRESDATSRTLRVGVSSGIARTTTTDFLLPLLTLENCTAAVRTSDTVDLFREMRGGSLDLLLCESEPSESTRRGLDVVLIESTELVAVAPVTVKPSETWDNVGFIHYRSTSPFRWHVDAFLEKSALEPRIVAEADDSQFLVEAALRACLVAIVPRSVARDGLASGQLQELAAVEATRAGVYAVYASTDLAELVRSAVDALRVGKGARSGV